MLFNIVLVVHLIVCVLLTIVVLMQSGRGGSISAAFGGGGGGQIFGGRETATFLGKMTTYLAIAFFVTSLGLAFLSGMRGGSTESSALRRAAREQAGAMVPEERKPVGDVMGNVPPPVDGQQGQAPAGQPAQQQAPADQGND